MVHGRFVWQDLFGNTANLGKRCILKLGTDSVPAPVARSNFLLKSRDMLRNWLGRASSFQCAHVPCDVDARSGAHSSKDVDDSASASPDLIPAPADRCAETLILFDWDDTLCPTSAMLRGVSFPSAEELGLVSREADSVLVAALKLADRVLIVTNSKEGWVEATCTAWMPTLFPTLKLCEIVSARAEWEPHGFTSPLDWKKMAFSEIIGRFCVGTVNETWKNVISVGDAAYEREALLAVMGSGPMNKLGLCRAKVVKFDDQPSTRRLSKQLRLVSLGLGQLVQHEGDLDLKLDSVGFLPNVVASEDRQKQRWTGMTAHVHQSVAVVECI